MIVRHQRQPAGSETTNREIPPLDNGDRLSRPEFERRYAAMPSSVKAELVEGMVYMPSPARIDTHGRPQSRLIGLMFLYEAATPGVCVADNATLRLDWDNEPQPDAMLWIEHRLGGAAAVDDDGYLTGAPELVAEVAASSASYDLGPKLEAYRRHGVREYLVWRTYDRAIDRFALREGSYAPAPADESGVLKSEVFAGLWIDAQALLANDLAAAVATLQRGLASPEHEAFVGQLRDRAG